MLLLYWPPLEPPPLGPQARDPPLLGSPPRVLRIPFAGTYLAGRLLISADVMVSLWIWIWTLTLWVVVEVLGTMMVFVWRSVGTTMMYGHAFDGCVSALRESKGFVVMWFRTRVLCRVVILMIANGSNLQHLFSQRTRRCGGEVPLPYSHTDKANSRSNSEWSLFEAHRRSFSSYRATCYLTLLWAYPFPVLHHLNFSFTKSLIIARISFSCSLTQISCSLIIYKQPLAKYQTHL